MRSLCAKNCFHFHEENCFDLVGDSLAATEKRVENLFATWSCVGGCVLYLKHVELLGVDREGAHEERRIIQVGVLYWLILVLSEVSKEYSLD